LKTDKNVYGPFAGSWDIGKWKGDIISGLERHLAAEMGQYRSRSIFLTDFLENGVFYDKVYYGRLIQEVRFGISESTIRSSVRVLIQPEPANVAFSRRFSGGGGGAKYLAFNAEFPNAWIGIVI
jgi:hypothetical protein